MQIRISIQHEDFNLEDEIDAMRDTSKGIGAIVTFTGVVRAEDDLESLTLEHYPAMTESEIARCIEEAQLRWPLLAATVIHRIGKLSAGERIVLVAVASSHRKAAFEACEFIMDYLKNRAPFWKEEQRNGKTSWVEHRHSDDQAAKRWR
jgi:molybdopterin synthase catalytic subunit